MPSVLGEHQIFLACFQLFSQQLYIYMEEHFKYESSDRLMLLHAWRTLDKTLQGISPFSNKFFRTLMCIVITKAKSSIASSSRAGSISSTKSDSETFQNGIFLILLWYYLSVRTLLRGRENPEKFTKTYKRALHRTYIRSYNFQTVIT